jgi:hypothetical protein
VQQHTRHLHLSSLPAGNHPIELTVRYILTLYLSVDAQQPFFFFSLKSPDGARLYMFLGNITPPERLPDLWYREYLLTSQDWESATEDVNELLRVVGLQLGPRISSDEDSDVVRNYTLIRLTET